LKLDKGLRPGPASPYLEGLTNPELVREVKRRLSNIKTDAILSDGYIEEYIEDAPFSVFQTIASSEKPDVIAAKLLREGPLCC
jgi:spore germination protein KA